MYADKKLMLIVAIIELTAIAILSFSGAYLGTKMANEEETHGLQESRGQ